MSMTHTDAIVGSNLSNVEELERGRGCIVKQGCFKEAATANTTTSHLTPCMVSQCQTTPQSPFSPPIPHPTAHWRVTGRNDARPRPTATGLSVRLLTVALHQAQMTVWPFCSRLSHGIRCHFTNARPFLSPASGRG